MKMAFEVPGRGRGEGGMRKGHRNEKKKKSDESDNKREGVRKKGERLAVYSTFELRNVDETKEREKRKAKEKQQTKRTSKGNKPDLATMRPDCVTNCSESRPLNVSGTRRQTYRQSAQSGFS